MGPQDSGLSVYLLDASTCALLSEDFPGTTRWHFQRELVTCHSGAPARTPAGDVALVASSGGRAQVQLHPSSDAAALQAALQGVQPAGEASLEAGLKLALLVSRRFPAGSTHVTAFVASAGAAASLAAQPAAAVELQQRCVDARITLDVAVLCSAEELGAAAVEALTTLTGGSSSSAAAGSSSASSGDEDDGAAARACSSTSRLVWLAPVEGAEEAWQQLEPALEQLERRGRSSLRPAGRATSAVPRRISRAPRQLDPLRHPRGALLAARSGVQQPALCRGESLSRLGHLSSDGMARPWLPTYSSLAKQAAAGARAAAGAGTPSADMCYVEVQPLPRWRTLLKVAAGRMLPAPAQPASPTAAEGDSSSSSSSSPLAGKYATASSELLQRLEALSVLDEPESPRSGSAEPPAPVRYQPDSARGWLRLLQGTKEPHLLKLVWSPQAPAGPPAGAAAPNSAQQQEQEPLDMFGPDSSGSSSGSTGSGAGSSSRANATLLGYMPAATVAASAARGPILREGCELWETAAEFAWELLLPTPEGDGSAAQEPSGGASASTSRPPAPLPAAVEARQLPNGAQLLLVTPQGSGGQLQHSGQRPKAAAAFWLQQRLEPGSLQPPAYGTAAPAAPAAEEPAAEQEPQEQGEAAEGPAALLAAALLGHLRQPPAVDLRPMRRDVKSGAIQVTPITVGPLPAQFVRDIVATRSAMLAASGVENFDTWEDRSGRSAVSSSSGGGEQGSAGDKAAAGEAEAGACAGGGASGSKGLAPEAAAGVMQQHKSAVLSLLRQRLGRQPGGKPAGSAAKERAATPAPASEAGAPAEGPPPAEAIPCSTPQHAPGPVAASSYSSSSAGTPYTPYGTPLAILPHHPLHHPGTAAAAAGGGGSAEVPHRAGAGEAHPQLPGRGDQLVPPKQEGPVLVSAASQGEPGDGDLFQLD